MSDMQLTGLYTPYSIAYTPRMIGHLRGLVLAKREGYAILEVGGVGYKVALTRATLTPLAVGSELSVWTHMAVREVSQDIYGFDREDELRLFELLLNHVSGIGPKSALAILDIATVETLRSAIAGGNAAYLTNVSGIGKKTAEKIILELRDKVGISAESESAALQGDEEALEAMRALGYTASEARDALRKVPTSITGGSERIRAALKIVGGK